MLIIVIRLFACFSIQGYIGSRYPYQMYRHDGVSQANELLTLNQAGIASIDLDSNGDNRFDSQDTAFNEVEICQDRKQDGYASAKERQDPGRGQYGFDRSCPCVWRYRRTNQCGGVVATRADGQTQTRWDLKFNRCAYGDCGLLITGSVNQGARK